MNEVPAGGFGRGQVSAIQKNDKNNSINPEDYTCGSHLKVWWKCLICGNEWEATIKNRAENESGCPKCKKYARTSFPEQALLFYLRQMYPSAENSYTEIFYPTNRELDIFIPELKIGIEYDGQVWHSDERSRKVGIEKYEICKKNNIKLIRVSESPENMDDNCDVFIYRDGFTSSSLDDAIKKVIAIISPNKIDIDTEKDRTPIISQYFGIIKNKSIAAKYPEVAKEWDYGKNGDITPEMVNCSANIKYWWECEKGHSYQATPANKCIQKSGCPICSGRIVLKGFNDLQTRFPEVAAEWDDERNQPIQAFDVAPGSVKKYWWLCPKGHCYTASPNSRTSNKSGCPYCAGKKVLPGFNDLLSTNPVVGQFWNYNKNKGIDPKQFSAGSKEKVWWVCPNGHEYEKKIVSFVNYPNCPVCNGRLLQTGINDLQTTHPDLVKEWDYKKNTILPESITRTFAEKVWWKCNTCGTEWQQKVNVRVISGSGCPRCGYKIKLGETRRRNGKKK